MANRITLLRIALLFIAIGFIYTYTVLGELFAFGMVLVVFLLDGVDGAIARREGRADETGAVLDIFGDRVVENALWIVFAHVGLIPVWIPIVVMVRGLATDAVRSMARTRGESAFGKTTMMHSLIGRWVVASRASRVVYASAKAIAFGYLILYLALIQAQVRGTDLGEMEKWLPVTYKLGMWLVYFTVAICLARGLPVLVEGRRYARFEPKSG